MRTGVVDENGLGGGLGQVLNDLSEGERCLCGGPKSLNDVLEVNGGVIVVVESLAAGGNVGEVQLRGWLPSSKGLELVDEGLANASGTCY